MPLPIFPEQPEEKRIVVVKKIVSKAQDTPSKSYDTVSKPGTSVVSGDGRKTEKEIRMLA